MVRESIHETLEYMFFPDEHRRHIRTNSPLERVMREIRRCGLPNRTIVEQRSYLHQRWHHQHPTSA
ncbi:MAG: hypothetical protein EA384_00420 [Spirochaetaceae bacterium]|nr:MAG: hypothetical protein EA384_00420 [Spirochaetaceae bacterium]